MSVKRLLWRHLSFQVNALLTLLTAVAPALAVSKRDTLSTLQAAQFCPAIFAGDQSPSNKSVLEELRMLNDGDRGWAAISAEPWLPKGYLKRVARLEAERKFPFNSESTFLIRDFDQFDIRNELDNKDVATLFNFIETQRATLESVLDFDRNNFRLITGFAEIRTSNKKEKYQTAHFDEDVNDFVAVTSLTRNRGTLHLDSETKSWIESGGVGRTFFLSTARRKNPTFHRAVPNASGTALITRFRIVANELNQSSFRKFRLSRLEETEIKFIKVVGKRYQVNGQLGEASTKVYLARDDQKTLSVIKVRIKFHVASTAPVYAYYEIAASLFYREKGITVPRVLATEISDESIVMVKEYVEGLTYEEVENIENLVPKERKSKISKQANETVDFLSDHVFGGRYLDFDHPTPSKFTQWLNTNKKRIESENPQLLKLRSEIQSLGPSAEQELIDISNNGDIKKENLLWIPSSQQWVLFDP
jgi:hypothetical protein